MIEKGSRAPEFTLRADDGQEISLSDLRGRKVVLYFYPKDDTSGCTTQACALRDEMPAFDSADVVVLGVSPDSEASHVTFRDKHDLNFPLLVDEDHVVAEAYGVWKEKSMYGNRYMGIERSTFLIDEQGAIEELWRKVRPEEHTTKVRNALGI